MKKVRNSKQVVNEVSKLFKVIKEYDIDNRAFMFDEIKSELMNKDENINSFLYQTIQALKDFIKEDCIINDEIIDKDLLNYYNGYINKFSSLNIELLNTWQNNLIPLKNICEEMDIIQAKIRIK